MFNSIGSKLVQIFSSSKKKIDEDLLFKIEEILVLSDISIDLVDDILHTLKTQKFNKDILIDDLKQIIKRDLKNKVSDKLNINLINKIKNGVFPYTVVFSGVNGAGKTTTISKLAYQLKLQGLRVLICAADTFRAVATEQLKSLSDSINVDIISNNNLSPSSLVFDAYKKALNEKFDILLIDTAGRLQTKVDLMNELKKIDKTLTKQNVNAPHDSILVLDASIGQNMLSQVEVFLQYTNITGFILTKLDGSSKGGAVISLLKKYSLPVYMIGYGENIKDLNNFNYDEYINNILDIKY